VAAFVYPLVIDQGADYLLSVPVLDSPGDPVLVDGWTAAGQIRAGYAENLLLHQFDLVVTGTEVVIQITAAVSSAWKFRFGHYDVELTSPGGSVTRLIEGPVVVRPETTR
jgi:hypothetical protein